MANFNKIVDDYQQHCNVFIDKLQSLKNHYLIRIFYVFILCEFLSLTIFPKIVDNY